MNIVDVEILENVLINHPFASRFYKNRSRFPKAVERIEGIYNLIDGEQRLVFLELLKRYEVHDDYARLVSYAFSHCERFINFSPVVMCSPHDHSSDDSKSGHAVLYEFKSMAKGMGYGDEILKIFNVLTHNIKKMKDRVAIIVDDFSGSGETFLNAVVYLEKMGFERSRICCVSLYSMKEAMDLLDREGVFSCSAIIASKAISDSYFDFESDQFNVKEKYLGIEKALGISGIFSMGYAKSESLVTLKRTPDNTLPIFWSNGEAGVVLAPFSR